VSELEEVGQGSLRTNGKKVKWQLTLQGGWYRGQSRSPLHKFTLWEGFFYG